jgi:hypothetical protein
VVEERFSEIPGLKNRKIFHNEHNTICGLCIFLYFLQFSYFFSKETGGRAVDIVIGIGFFDLAFYPLWGARDFCLLQTTRCFGGDFSAYSVGIGVFLLLVLTVHFSPPCIKRKGTIHPATGHEAPEGNIELYTFFNAGCRWSG